MTTTALRSTEGCSQPVIPARRTAISSSLPRLPSGLVKLLTRLRILCIATTFGRSIRLMMFHNCSNTFTILSVQLVTLPYMKD
ncbi:hypothetical protein D3C75_700900 [compost metagenome]